MNEHEDANSNETAAQRRVQMKALREEPLAIPSVCSPLEMNPLRLPPTALAAAQNTEVDGDATFRSQQSDNGRSMDDPQIQNSGRRFTAASAAGCPNITGSNSNQQLAPDDAE
jgi:hypothetical protein